MTPITEKAKSLFIKSVMNNGSDPFRLMSHVPEAERWAGYMCKQYPGANREVIMLAVWLHDIGHYPVKPDIDHAITSEKIARKFLFEENYPPKKAEKVLHCIRAHRCKDVLPKSLEAKIMAFIDSASHMTDAMYFDIAKDDNDSNKEFRVYAKMQRDWRDLNIFPDEKKKLASLYKAWHKLISEYENLKL